MRGVAVLLWRSICIVLVLSIFAVVSAAPQYGFGGYGYGAIGGYRLGNAYGGYDSYSSGYPYNYNSYGYSSYPYGGYSGGYLNG